MSRRIDALLTEWAEDIANNAHRTGFSGINVIEKILRDPGVSTKGSRHRVHYWPRNKRISKINKAMHQIDRISQMCLVVKYGRVLSEDGNIFTKQDLAKNSSLTLRRFDTMTSLAVRDLEEILKNIGKNP